MDQNTKIIAHRGVFDNQKIPENSIASFKKALLFSYAIELDVQLTKDNVLVVFHDDSLERMTHKNGFVQEKTYAELQKLSLLNTKEKIPTLKEVLNLVHGKVFLDIEIKPTKRIVETCNILLSELSHYSNYSLKSFHPKIVRYLRVHYPQVQVGYLISNHYQNRFYQWSLASYFMIHYSKAEFLSIHKKLMKTKKFQKLKRKYPISVWTVKTKEEMKDSSIQYICNCLPY